MYAKINDEQRVDKGAEQLAQTMVPKAQAGYVSGMTVCVQGGAPRRHASVYQHTHIHHLMTLFSHARHVRHCPTLDAPFPCAATGCACVRPQWAVRSIGTFIAPSIGGVIYSIGG